jgi:hypothetical protein
MNLFILILILLFTIACLAACIESIFTPDQLSDMGIRLEKS